MKITSNTFDNGKYFELSNKTPHIKWDHVQSAKSYIVLINNKTECINNWLLPKISPYINELPEIETKNEYLIKLNGYDIIQGKNSFRQYGFNNVKIEEKNIFVIKVYAINKVLEDKIYNYKKMMFQIQNSIIDFGEYYGWN
tara:strand:+ start:334 stop:756 length:423 start_codon:yes stop_codon:yes gene_type:complete